MNNQKTDNNKIKLNETQLQIFDFVGEHSGDFFAVSEISEALGDDNSTGKISKALARMVELGVLEKSEEGLFATSKRVVASWKDGNVQLKPKGQEEDELNDPIEENPEELEKSIKTSFKADKMFCEFPDWKLSIKLNKRLPQVFQSYEIIFTLDESDFCRRLENLAKRHKEIEEKPALGLLNDKNEDEQKSRIKQIKKDIKGVEKELERTRKKCPTINFIAHTKKTEYDGDATKCIFIIPSTAAQKINNVRGVFNEKYRVTLKHS